MSITASLLQAVGIVAVFASLWMIGGVWILVLGLGAFTTVLGLAIERTSRTS
ncbi:MAG: hypothetical protein HOE14_19105 [Gemmatimonadales bacterium]|jgi:hypothetical protein|nr:hypothetical protein [Gemmatimonadales bacterium]